MLINWGTALPADANEVALSSENELETAQDRLNCARALSRTQVGPQQRTFRPVTTGPYATKQSVVGGLNFLSEDMHNTLLATCCEALITEENEGREPDVYSYDHTLQLARL